MFSELGNLSELDKGNWFLFLYSRENQTGLPDKIMNRRVTLKYSNLDRLEFKGGNHTGIFITKQHKLLERNEGEQVKAVSFKPI